MEQMNFGTRIEELLNNRQVKPADFYREIGIASQNYYDWKKKGATPNAITALKIAMFFGVSVEYLLTGKDFATLQSESNYKEKYENLKKQMQEVINKA